MKTRRHDYSTGSSPQQAAGVTAPGRRQRQICSHPYLSRGLIRTENFGEMLPNKRGADDLARFSNENKRTCSGEEETHSYWDNQGIWSVLSNLQRSVVSISFFDEHKLLFASSGIAVECQCNLTRFVTSASLGSALDVVKNRQAKVKIVLDHEGNVAWGIVDNYDLDYHIVVIRVMSALEVYCIPLNHEVELMSHGTKVVAVGRDVTGVLSGTSGALTATHGSVDSGYYMFSTCILREDMQGGALFDSYGNFVGMNLFSDMQRSIFLPRIIILERLGHFQTSEQKGVYLELVKPIRPSAVKLYSHPKDSMKDNTFQESFGEAYPKGVWRKLRKEVRSNIFGNAVALASFNGESKFFSCTGFFIDYVDNCPTILTSASLVRNSEGTNEFVEGLKIVVLLPNNERREGKLEHWSLHYNVALVSVKNYNVDHPANLKLSMVYFSGKVVAVGRCFESGVLMAASGQYTRWSGKISEILHYTTCKTTKAGIGGPLVDVNGNYVGMNFYDAKLGTPYLLYDDLCGVLDYFKKKQTTYLTHTHLEVSIVEDGKGPPNLWLVPERSIMNKHEAKVLRAALAEPYRYGYKHGHFCAYK